MPDQLVADPLVPRLREALKDLYGPRLSRIVLFGSRARGDARADSDYDVAVFLTHMEDRWGELQRLADLRVDVFDATGLLADIKAYVVHDYGARTPLMHEIRRDGLDL